MKDGGLIEIVVEVIEEASLALLDFLTALSPQGIVEGWRWEDDGVIESGPASVYFERMDAQKKISVIEEYLASLVDIWGEGAVLRFEVREVEDGWIDKYQKYFRAKKVTDKIVVSPPWEKYRRRDGEILIRILPGCAFGTGTHETTRLCLSAMEEIFSNGRIESFLDVGTGSGILAVAGALLGAERVTGIENDPDSVSSAIDNVKKNGLSQRIEIRSEAFGESEGEIEKFDLVAANLTRDDIRRLSVPLSLSLTHGGHLIISGFLSEEEDLLEGAFYNLGVTTISKRRLGQWSSIVLREQKT